MMKFLTVFLALLIGMSLGMVILGYAVGETVYEYEDTVENIDQLPEVDAIVCLAGGKGRIRASADIWKRYWDRTAGGKKGKLPVFYISGMGPRADWAVMARQVRKNVLEVLKPEHVVIENESANTHQNAVWLGRTAQERRWSVVLLITSSYHMKRAQFVFERVLGDSLLVETYTPPQKPFLPRAWRSSLIGVQVTLGEYLKYAYYRMIF